MKNIFRIIVSLILATAITGLSAANVFCAEEGSKKMEKKYQSLSVATYNIKDGRHKIDDAAEKRTVRENLENIAKLIVQYSPDIIGLQEVDNMADRTGKVDQIKLLSELTGYPYYQFTKAINIKGGEYGHAILSRYPIVSHDVVVLPAFKSGQEQRALSHAVIDVNGKLVNFYNTHINSGKDGTSADVFSRIGNATAGVESAILTGDFNSNYKDGFFAALKTFKFINHGNYLTTAGSSIDNIGYTKDFTVELYGVASEDYSDHLMVYTVLKFEK